MFRKVRAGGDHRRGGVSKDAPVEARLIERIVEGDRRAFEDLYRLYQPRLTRFLQQMLRRPSLVEDVLNETLMYVWERAERYNGQSRVSTWIFAIAYRKGLNARRRWDPAIEDPQANTRASEEAGPEERLGRSKASAALREAMAGLSPDHRAVVDLTYFHDMSCREIAEIMACPVDTVKTRMFHARRRLKRALAGDAGDWL